MASCCESGIENHRKMDISEWKDSHRQPAEYGKAKTPNHWVANIIGVLLTFLMHGVAVTSILHASHDWGPLRKARNTATERHWSASETLTLIQLPAPQEVRVALDNSLSLALTKIDIKPAIELNPPTFVSIEALESNDSPPAAIDSSVAATEHEELLSIYVRQIRARIERVWRRPRAPITEGILSKLRLKDEPFQCELHITQDPLGNVEDIALDRCNGSLAWQQSLVAAIHQASPLPGPPNASIFSSSVGLTFTARAYRPGVPAEEYEALPRQLVSAE
jgi:hypothetical protein